jgi:hypothetical protein
MAAQDIAYILEGPVRIFIGNAANSSVPDVMPADTVPIGASPGGNWREFGFTTVEGARLSFQREYREVSSGQSRTPVKHLRGTKNERCSFNILELSLENFRDALGYGIISSVAPGVGVNGNRKLRLTDDGPILYAALLLEWIAPPDNKNMPRRVWFPFVQATSAVETSMRPNEEGNISAEFRRVGGSNGVIEILDVVAGL